VIAPMRCYVLLKLIVACVLAVSPSCLVSRTKNHLLLEHSEGYVKALEKSTSTLSTTREVFKQWGEGLDGVSSRKKTFLYNDML